MSLATAPGAFAAVALTDAEAGIIAQARKQLARVEADSFPWPPPRTGNLSRRDDLKATLGFLRDSLDDLTALRGGDLHPATVFPDLDDGRDDALAVALRLVLQDIAEWTIALANHAGMAEAAANGGES